MNKLTAEQRIQKAHVRLMRHRATMEYSSAIMLGTTEVRDDIPTACTNGKDKLYGRSFVEGLSDPELAAVVLHENLHMVFQQLYVWKHLWKEDAQLANQAADYCINLLIKDIEKQDYSLVKLPEQGLISERFRDMDTKQIFDLLKKDKEGGKEGGGDSMDEHVLDEITPEEAQELRKEIDQALRQGALLAGKMGGDQSRALRGLTEPQVDWREQLREFMSAVAQGKDDSTWRRPNRRWLGQDIFMPSTISESMESMLVFVDTSGSIDDAMVATFMSEVKGVCDSVKPQVLHFLEVDDAVRSHEVYDETSLHRLEHKKQLKGGGGTDMTKVFSYIEENSLTPTAVVGLTDGYTPFPSTLNVPTLWAITTRGISAPVGSTIHINA
jgi:predicted metal-dependent peptidase